MSRKEKEGGPMKPMVDIYLPLDAGKPRTPRSGPSRSASSTNWSRSSANCGWEPQRPQSRQVRLQRRRRPPGHQAGQGRALHQFHGRLVLSRLLGQPDVAAAARHAQAHARQLDPGFPRSGRPPGRGGRDWPMSGSGPSRLFVEDFEKPETYADAVEAFLKTGAYAHPSPVRSTSPSRPPTRPRPRQPPRLSPE